MVTTNREIYKDNTANPPLKREETRITPKMGIRLRSSQREKKRYIAFEVLAKNSISLSKIQKAVALSMVGHKGEMGLAESGMIIVPERWQNQQGILRVNRKRVNDAIAALALTKTIDGEEVCIHTMGQSGMISKAHKKIAS